MLTDTHDHARRQRPAVLYGAAAIAQYLGIAEKATRHLIARGTIPTFRIGRTVAARPERIDEALVLLEQQAGG